MTSDPGLAFRRAAAEQDAPSTRAQLQAWFDRLGFHVADHAVMPDMDAPMDAFWSVYSGAHATTTIMGGRGSGKTRGLSLTETAKNKFLPGYNIAHIGATKGQANRCYGFVREYIGPGGPLRDEVFKNLLTDTAWRNNSHLEVLPGTINAVSGGHPHCMVIDEFDLMKYDVFQQAIGMPQSDENYDAQTVLVSALYKSQGTFRQVLTGTSSPVGYRWSVIDAMEPCDGRDGRPTCYDAIAVHNGGPPSTPPRCPLWDDCKGRGMFANGHKKRQDIITEWDLTDEFTWRTQYMSEDAQRAGVVYERFAPDVSDDGSTNVTIAAEYDPELPVYWGADEGFENPTVFMLLQQAGDGGLNVFDEIYVRHLDHEECLDMVHQEHGLDGKSPQTWYVRPKGERPRGPYKRPDRAYPDPSAPQFGRVIAKRLGSGARVRSRGEAILDGVNVLRRLIRTNSGKRLLRIHPRCTNLIREMTFWRLELIAPGVWGDDPEEDEGGSNPDHCCDGLRYAASHLSTRIIPGAV